MNYHMNMSKSAMLLCMILLCISGLLAQPGKVDKDYYSQGSGAYYVTKVLLLPDSSVIAGGTFTLMNSQPASRISKFDKEGNYDPSFQTGTGFNGTVYALALQSDGKILVGGSFTSFNGITCNRIARINSNGSLDTSFNIGTGFSYTVFDILLQPDDKIMVGGQFAAYRGIAISKTARLNSNGTMDTAYKQTAVMSDVYSITRQPDGKYLLGGANTITALRRVSTTGMPDTTFNNGGNGPNGTVLCVRQLVNGKVCVTGNFSQYNGTSTSGAVILDSSGAISTGFAIGSGFNAQVEGFYEQPDGKIIFHGKFTTYKGTGINRIVRTDALGTIDTTFKIGSGFDAPCSSLIPMPDGALVAGGQFLLYNTYSRFGLAKLNADGSINLSGFDNAGPNGIVYAIAKQSDGSTILGGDFTRFGIRSVGYVIRLNPQGLLDTTFNLSGIGANNRVSAIYVMPDDKILIGGLFTNYNSTARTRVALLNANGTLNTSFTLGANNSVNRIRPGKNGKVYLMGNFTTFGGQTRRAVACLKSDLTLDSDIAPGFQNNVTVTDMAEQPDGKKIFVGNFAKYADSTVGYIVRLDSVGNRDTSFHSGSGFYLGGSGPGTLSAVLLQADGNIVAGGQFSTYNGISRNAIARLLHNGTLDTSYTPILTNRLFHLEPYGNSVIAAGNFVNVNGQARNGIVCLDNSGSIDPQFDAGIGVGGLYSPYVTTAYRDPINGRVLVGGYFGTVQETSRRYFAGLVGGYLDGGAAIDSIKVDTLLCAGGMAKVVFKKAKPFNKGNTFTVQLSDSTGSFASPVAIGSKAAEGLDWDTVDATIPTSTGLHFGYKVRLQSTNSVAVSNASHAFKVDTLSPPVAPISRSVCSDIAYTFVFDSIQTNADSIEWAFDSLFNTSSVISKTGSFSVTVDIGETKKIWLRNRSSSGYCFSTSVNTAIGVNSLPTPIIPVSQWYETDSSSVYTLDSITAIFGNELEWRLSTDFSNIIESASPLNLSISVPRNQIDTLFIRSKNSLTGCVSSWTHRPFYYLSKNFVCGYSDTIIAAQFLSTGTAPDCANSYNYHPDHVYPEQRPIVTLYVNFHYIGLDDGTGMWNPAGNSTGDGLTWANMYFFSSEFVKLCNEFLEDNRKQICPNPNNIDFGEIQYRYEIYKNPELLNDKGVYFWANSADYYSYNHYILNYLKNKYSVNGSKVIDIFFLGPAYQEIVEDQVVDINGNGIPGEWLNDRCGRPGGVATGANLNNMSCALSNSWCTFYSGNPNYTIGSIAQLLNHEIGHDLGLNHTNQGQCSDVNSSSACFNEWTSGNPESNNIMGYNRQMNALSPCQLGIVHKRLVEWEYLTVANQNCVKNDFCEISDPDLEIYAPGQTIVWNSARNMTSNVIIESGTTLKITCTVGMPKNAKIIVKQNAKLWVTDGGTITNICGDLWDGIVMEGDKTQPQALSTTSNATAYSNQPFVYLSNAFIENARIGVSVWKTADGGVSQNTTDNFGGTGGILRAEHSTFRNNIKDVGFMWYKNMWGDVEKPNLSYFHDCRFVTDDAYAAARPDHASLWGVRGVKFLGCTFENTKTTTAPEQALYLGRGIVAVEAAIEVNDYPPYAEYEWGNQSSKFNNLHEGVHLANGTMQLYPSKVTHAKFNKCIRGIRNEGADLVTIIGNEFTIGGNEALTTEFGYYDNADYYYQEGVVLHGGMAGFVVEQNTFNMDDDAVMPAVGIRADATGGEDKRIYNNKFYEMSYANLANRQNFYKNYFDPSFVPTGLTYWCNNSSGTGYIDMAVTEPDPTDLYQIFTGIRPSQGQSNLSAGNTFTHKSSSLLTDINNRSDYSDMRYWYYGTANTGNNQYPAYVTDASVQRLSLTLLEDANGCPNHYILPSDEDPVGGCPSCPNISGLAGVFGTVNASLKQAKLGYANLIDGGSTAALLSYIDTTSNGDTLMAKLGAYAPNLSSIVLDKAARRSTLDTIQKYQLMKANAEGLNAQIMEYLDKRLHLPQWMLDSLNMAKNSLTYRSYLLDSLMQLSAAREQAGFAALRLIAEDTAGLDLDSYRAWLDSLETPWSYRQMLGTYMYEGRYDTIAVLSSHYDSLLSDPFDSATFGNFAIYLSSYASWMQNDTSIIRMDSANYAGLVAQANSTMHHSPGTLAARNVLSFFYDSLYFSPGMVPDISFAKKESGDKGQVYAELAQAKGKTQLKIYPNPAKDRIMIEYAFDNEATLIISDMYGRAIVEQRVQENETKVEINTANFSSGMYFVKIDGQGLATEKAKFNIMK